VDRYLQAVRFWLPKGQQADIIAELSEDLRSQIEEKEAQLDHTLKEADVEDLLRQRGRPVLVANRYLPQQHLIGPVLFPIYRFVLKVVALGYLVPWIVVWAGLMLLSPSYRASQTAPGWLAAIGAAWSTWGSIALVLVGAVTVVFAVLERVEAKSHFIERWDPRKLPAVRDTNQIPRSASIIEVAANITFLIWWAANMSSPVVVDRPTVRIVLTSHWHYFFWGFLWLAIANTVLAAVNLVHPYWTRLRAGLRLTSDAVGAALFCWMLKVSIAAQITVANVSAARTIEITNAINLWMARALPIAVIAGVAIAVVDVHRILRVRAAKTLPPHTAATAAV
jgi:hypothetical protein